MEQQEIASDEGCNRKEHAIAKAKVKSEPETQAEESEEEPADDFLDEILNSAGSNVALKSEPNTNANDAEEIDPSFFDDILSLKAEKERRQAGATRNQLRLKRERVDLEDGEVEDDDENVTDDACDVSNKTKSKISKSKRKKSKDQRSPQKLINENVQKSTTSRTQVRGNDRPRLKVRAEFSSFSTPRLPTPEESSIREERTTIETHIGSGCSMPLQLSVRHEEQVEEKPEKILTPEEKLAKALERVKFAKNAFLKAQKQKERQFYPNNPVFSYTPTVRKLPTSFSHFTQNLYDNRSPLHTVNNVTFEFNSMATRLNLEEYGLESLPPKSKTVARILAYDVDTLYAKKQLIKIPDKIHKSSEKKANVEDREICEPSNSTLYMNVMVQTEAVKVIPTRRRDFYRDKAIQFTPSTNVIGTQTNSMYTGHGGDLPLFRVIRGLNENQLEALDDFVQFILEPAGNSGLDVYQQRKRLAEIYKTSQIPVQVALSSSSFKRSADEAELSEIIPIAPPPPVFERYYDFNNGESSPYPHSQTTERRRSNPPESRNIHSQPINRYNGMSVDGPSQSVKYYGRGGMRR